eukprot:1140623-Pelagomonas_calceolata.AAC.1
MAPCSEITAQIRPYLKLASLAIAIAMIALTAGSCRGYASSGAFPKINCHILNPYCLQGKEKGLCEPQRPRASCESILHKQAR